jgi:hypothetical protein
MDLYNKWREENSTSVTINEYISVGSYKVSGIKAYIATQIGASRYVTNNSIEKLHQHIIYVPPVLSPEP